MTTEKTGQTYMDMVRGFGDKLGLPQIDVEKLIEANRKNLDALNESAVAAAGGAQAVVRKQREVLEAGLEGGDNAGSRISAARRREGDAGETDGICEEAL